MTYNVLENSLFSEFGRCSTKIDCHGIIFRTAVERYKHLKQRGP